MKHTSPCTVKPHCILKVKNTLLKAVYCVTVCTNCNRVSPRSVLHQIFMNTPNTAVFAQGIFFCLGQRNIMFITELPKSR